MATIVGGIGSSHVPAIGKAIAGKLQNEPYWKSFFEGYIPIHAWLEKAQPDIAIVFYNDHGLGFFIDKKPTFAIGVAPAYESADEGWGIGTIPELTGAEDMSWHICNELVEDEFDITICQEMQVDHGMTIPMQLMWPGNTYCHMKVIPVAINCEQHPMPSLKRCFNLGRSIANAVKSYNTNEKVVVLGTGGLSHQLDGERAGHINKEFDIMCMDKIVSQPENLFKYSNWDLSKIAGAQGPELNMWLGMRGALVGDVKELHRNYHAPISNTGSGTMLLANELRGH